MINDAGKHEVKAARLTVSLSRREGGSLAVKE
jgi:hypothetical protein